jgi:hypothetical protein
LRRRFTAEVAEGAEDGKRITAEVAEEGAEDAEELDVRSWLYRIAAEGIEK